MHPQLRVAEGKFTIDEKMLSRAKPALAPFRKKTIKAIAQELVENKIEVKELKDKLTQRNTSKNALKNWKLFYASRTRTPFTQFDPETQEYIKKCGSMDQDYVWLTQKELVMYILQNLNYRLGYFFYPATYIRDCQFSLFIGEKKIEDQEGLCINML